MTDDWNIVGSVALAIPAYNEADGIAGFLTDLDSALAELCNNHTFVIVNDVSTDHTVAVLDGLRPDLDGELIVETNARNSGHGPTVLNAYHRALETGAPWILQVDGDGQFEAEDIAVLFHHASKGNKMVTGQRTVRFDPWYRRVVTTVLPQMLRAGFSVSRRDINCPFRLYEADTLAQILAEVPRDSLTPHVLMTVLESRHPGRHVEIPVQHRPRRGDTEAGTMFGARDILIPKKLMLFLGNALRQLVEFRRTL